MAKKYYGVRNGRQIGIFDSWAMCQKSIQGYSGAEFKGFVLREDAAAYVAGEDPIHDRSGFKKSVTKSESRDEAYAFVDGSFNSETGVYGYGGFLIADGKKHLLQGNGHDHEMAAMRNVAGEILGSMAAVEKALSLHLTQLTIYYDYIGIEKWATGAWKRNKTGTVAYYDFMRKSQKQIHIQFVKVKGHAGIPGNEEADRLAKAAVNSNGRTKF